MAANAVGDGIVDLSVVIPAYNEEGRIGPSLERVVSYLGAQRWKSEVLVVVDGSRDRTAEIVRRVATDLPVRVLDDGVNRGKGACVRRGMLEARGDLRVFSDADLSTPIEEVERLVASVTGGYDVAIGSRHLPGSRIEVRQPWSRQMMGRAFNACTRRLVMTGIRDTQCGFKLFSAAAARSIFPRQRIERFGFDVEVLWIAHRLGLRVAEIPVTWVDDRRSTVRPISDAARMLVDLVRIRQADRKGLYALPPAAVGD
jgi:dolichyl-phosphate beta-glucosyltransferase